MPNDDLKERLDAKLSSLSSELKLHINYVNDKSREDFADQLKEISEITIKNKTDIDTFRKIILGIGSIVGFLGWESLKGLFR